MTTTSIVQGRTEPAFDGLRQVFERQFAGGEHLGAAVAVYHHGRLVADLWGGAANEHGQPWGADTMAVCYSTTKGLTSSCLHLLADRGLVNYDDPVARHWPEYATNGKEATTVYHFLTHQAGASMIPAGLTTDDLTDWDLVTRRLAAAEPAWEPGTASGYHAITFGYLVGELVRRIDGRSVGRFLRDEIAAPLALDSMFIGTPEEVEPRIAPLVSSMAQAADAEKMRAEFLKSAPLLARSLSPESGDLNALMNSRAGHAAEIPAINGIMTARDLARLYGVLATYGEIDGVRLYSEARVRTMSHQQTLRPDKVLIMPIGWALGYMTGGVAGWPQGPRTSAFGHAGLGGSIGFADPEIGMSFGLVLNALAADLIGYGRTAKLAEAARLCAEAAG